MNKDAAIKQQIIDQVINQLEQELERQERANRSSNDGARFSAAHAAKQRDTSGFEAAYLARGYAMQHHDLSLQIEELENRTVENFSGQEIDIGALVDVELCGKMYTYFLLNCGGGTELIIEGQSVTVVTPESPVGKALMGNIDCGFFSFRPGTEGIILYHLPKHFMINTGR